MNRNHIRVLGAFLVGLAVGLLSQHAKATEITEVDTAWALFGNHKVIVERFDDPRVENVSCYVSYAKTGGIGAAIGFSEDPSRFSIACRAVGQVNIVSDIPINNEEVFSRNSSPFFKQMHVNRVLDKEKNVLVYLVTSDKLIDGSPFNSISVVPLNK